VSCLTAPELDLDIETLAHSLCGSQLIMRVVAASKEDQQGCIKEVVCNVKVQHG